MIIMEYIYKYYYADAYYINYKTIHIIDDYPLNSLPIK